MEPKDKLRPEERVWLRNPHRNNNSLAMTIPAGIRKALNWHMNAPLVVELVGDHMEVRQLDMLKVPNVEQSGARLRRRKKSWKRGPQEEKPKSGGMPVERIPPLTQEP